MHFRRRHRVVALDFLEAEIDAGRKHQTVIADGAAIKHNFLGGGIDSGHFIVNQLDAMIGSQPLARDLVFVQTAAAADHQVAERAGNEGLVAVDQHHFDGRVVHADIFGNDSAAIAAADHHHATPFFRHDFSRAR